MAEIHISRFTAETREACLAALLAWLGVRADVVKAANGKPFLRDVGGRTMGLSVTHLRQANPRFSLMAVSTEPFIAVDAELWPKETGDQAFIDTVAAQEDLNLKPKTKRDFGRLLWVAKEAALKATGEVMVDPRHVKLVRGADGVVIAKAARAATTPLPDVALQFFEHDKVLLAVASLSAAKVVWKSDLVGFNPIQV